MFVSVAEGDFFRWMTTKKGTLHATTTNTYKGLKTLRRWRYVLVSGGCKTLGESSELPNALRELSCKQGRETKSIFRTKMRPWWLCTPRPAKRRPFNYAPGNLLGGFSFHWCSHVPPLAETNKKTTSTDSKTVTRHHSHRWTRHVTTWQLSWAKDPQRQKTCATLRMSNMYKEPQIKKPAPQYTV